MTVCVSKPMELYTTESEVYYMQLKQINEQRIVGGARWHTESGK